MIGQDVTTVLTTIVTFLSMAAVLSSLDYLGKECTSSDKYNRKPLAKRMRFDPEDLPYKNRSNNMFVRFFNNLLDPVYAMLQMSGLKNYRGDRNINWFFRKTYDPVGDYSADVFIESWVWMRETFFKMVSFLNRWIGIEAKKEYDIRAFEFITNTNEYTKYLYIPGQFFVSCLYMIALIFVVDNIIFIPIAASIMGALGLFLRALKTHILLRPFFFIILSSWILPAVITFFVQMYYGIYQLYLSGKGTFTKTFSYLIKHLFIVYLVVQLCMKSGLGASAGSMNASNGMLLAKETIVDNEDNTKVIQGAAGTYSSIIMLSIIAWTVGTRLNKISFISYRTDDIDYWEDKNDNNDNWFDNFYNFAIWSIIGFLIFAASSGISFGLYFK